MPSSAESLWNMMISTVKRILSFLLILLLLVACQPANPTKQNNLSNRQIAFNSFRDGHSEIYTMKADGSGQTRLTVFKTAENLISAWSPDGTRIAFVSKQDEGALVYVVNADGSHLVNLTNAYLTGNFDSDAFVVSDIKARMGDDFAPSETAENIRAALFDIQFMLADDPVLAAQKLTETESTYSAGFAAAIKAAAPETDQRIRGGFAAAALALSQSDVPAFAAARSQIWTALLAGSYAVVENALKQSDGSTAQVWLLVREFPILTTRFSHTSVNATLAVNRFANGEASREDALLSFHADLLDAYQSRLNQSMSDLAKADANGFPAKFAELAGLAEGYFHILAPAYAQQRGAESADAAKAAFAALRTSAVLGKEMAAIAQQVNESLRGFRALPLSASEQSRRSGQLMRFLSLVPVEYQRGVSNGQVIRDLEIQEAVAFHTGAYAAFSDLEYLFEARDSAKTAQAKNLLNQLDLELAETGKQTTITPSEKIQSQADSLIHLLVEMMPAQWEKDTTRTDIYEVYDTDPAWSPDGKQLAFASNDGVDLEAGGNLNVYVMNTNGSGAVKLTEHPKYNANPVWSPDGKKVAFVTDRNSNLDIYLMNVDGTEQVNLTDNPAPDLSITWSPDGQKILFVSERDGNGEICIINADGSGLTNLTQRSASFDQSPSWSPDGKRIVFASTENEQSDIFVMNADGSEQTNLTHSPKAYDITPKWSPDGTKIAFASNRDGNLEIYVMNADGSEQVNLTNNPDEDSDPAWQP